METFEEVCSKLDQVHQIQDRNGHTIVSANGGCAFVTDRSKPHLGGNIEGGVEDHAGDVWPWAIRHFQPKTFLDVGCAEGHAVLWFKSRTEASGVDGLPYNVSKACQLGVDAYCHDFCDGPFIFKPIDLIWCCDVVEHIDKQFLPNVLETFKQASTVLLTHGTSAHAADGWHHVTNEDDQFWIDFMRGGGFVHREDLTEHSRNISQLSWYKSFGKVFTKA